jgi:secernin
MTHSANPAIGSHSAPWSCDTFVAMPDVTTSGHVLLGKNSDRPEYDSQPLRFHPRRQAAAGDRLSLAYIEIDDAGESFAHLGASPYWCWGHEEGLNEWGVAIGNEALFTRDLAAAIEATGRGDDQPLGLLGMELLRLGLERGRTAEEALSAMTELVERYGQWGSGVPGDDAGAGSYDNSYIIADAREAWVLETVGTRWAARRVTSGTWSISNQPTIRSAWDRASADLVDHAVANGWWAPTGSEDFDFARAYVDPKTPLQLSHIRLQRSRQLLAEKARVDVEWAKRILRDHYEDTFLDGPNFNAALPDFLTLCMHSSPAGFTWGNTASSVVVVLPEGEDALPHMWWTPLTPCTGVYLPVFVHAGRVPAQFTQAGPAGQRTQRPDQAPLDTFAPDSYWWRFRRLLDEVKGGEQAWAYPQRQPIVRRAFDELESRWAQDLPKVEEQALSLRRDGEHDAMADVLADFTEACAREALAVVDELDAEFGPAPAVSAP